jgi:hypothetical protein
MSIRSVAAWAVGSGVVLLAFGARAQIPIASSSVTLDFTGFMGTGIVSLPSAGQLSSLDWSVTGMSDGNLDFGANGSAGDFARGGSSGGVTTGGIYAFDTGGGNVALGVQPSDADFTPGSLSARFKNGLSRPLLSVDVSYTIWVYADQVRSSSFDFSWSTDNVTFTSVPTLDFTTPSPTTPEWRSYAETTTIAPNVPMNGFLFLRFTSDDAGGSGGRDEIALDDLTLHVNAACGDGFVEGSEACEPASSDPCCSLTCQFADGEACSGGVCHSGQCVPPGTGGGGGASAGTGGATSGGATSGGATSGGATSGGQTSGGETSSSEGGASGEGGTPDEGNTGGLSTRGGAGGGGHGGTGRGGALGHAGSGARPGKGFAGEPSAAGGQDQTGGTGGTSGTGGTAGAHHATGGGGSSGLAGAANGAGLGGRSTNGGEAGTGPAARPTNDKSGCGCRVPTRAPTNDVPAAFGLGLLALVTLRRRARTLREPNRASCPIPNKDALPHRPA